MTIHPPASTRPTRSSKLVYLLLVVVAMSAVMIVWLRTPQIQVPSASEPGGHTMTRCTSVGTPRLSTGQDLQTEDHFVTHNQKVLKNDIEALHWKLTCSEARDAHTNRVMVTSFAASTVIILGFVWLRTRGANSGG